MPPVRRQKTEGEKLVEDLHKAYRERDKFVRAREIAPTGAEKACITRILNRLNQRIIVLQRAFCALRPHPSYERSSNESS